MKERIEILWTKKIYSFWEMALYVTAVAFIIGKDGWKSALSIFLCFIVLGTGAFVLSYIMDKQK